jgi:biotin carboxyl carrier protein
MKFVATVGGRAVEVTVTVDGGRYRVALGEQVWDVDARLTAQGISSLIIDGASHVAVVEGSAGECVVDVGGETYTVQVEEHSRHLIRTRGGAGGGAGAQTVKAPLPGKISHVAVQAGDAVAAGQSLLVIEAMKMENELKATAAGTVREVRVTAGQAVNAGDVLIVVEHGASG